MENQIKTKNIPTVFIIYGATGDLMGKKIVPALFHLYKKGKLPKLFKIIGFSRRQLTESQFIEFVSEILTKQVKHITKEDREKFLSYLLYQQGDFDDIASYKELASRLGIIDGSWSVCSNKLFYLAVPPQYYKGISEHLASSGLTIPCGPEEGWTRVIVEKPFGKNLKSAEDLDILLSKLFKEEQIYRIDHYLAKEMLQNILIFRFANNLFEEEWNSRLIEKINIRTWESIGAEGRGRFYDGIGALRDVGQNHLLQMLALVTMDRPIHDDPDSVRQKRAEILSTLKPLNVDEIKAKTFRGQYDGYKKIDGVDKDSKTETYFRTSATLSHPRWSGVEITLEAGKRLPLRKEIEIIFRHPTPCMCPPGKPHFQNRMTIGIEPKEGIVIEFWSKKPGLERKFMKRKFNFVLRRVNQRIQYVEEYEKLLLDCISGNQILFLSTPEIVACWKYIDSIVEAWDKDHIPLESYKPDTREIINKANKYFANNNSEIKREIGVVGLGKMGGNVARRLTKARWHVVGYNRTLEVTKKIEAEKHGNFEVASSLAEMIKKLKKPRVVITILTAGAPTDEIIDQITPLLDKDDILIDGANSFFEDTKRRNSKIIKTGIKFIDAGISGGPGGALNGACLMVGGDEKLFEYLKPLFVDMARPGAVMHFDGIGAGHFVKMVHNGIEYGMMQSIAEGFNLMKNGPYKDLKMQDITTIYQNGSVVESRLVGWLADAFAKFGNDLEALSGAVG
ncbi:MAG TPA: glucose-6-phosphate dehydrogenase, partial [Patescibacteria group bacterium]|nr:glucose-6-phosphate dehydrogenase [Patescibacteria group bacterium]